MKRVICILAVPLLLAGCAGLQRRVVEEAEKQATVVVFTPEQTESIREMAAGQMPEECPTAVGSFVKNTEGKVTLILRCD